MPISPSAPCLPPPPPIAVPVGIRPTRIDRVRWQKAALAHSLRTVGLVHRVGEWVS